MRSFASAILVVLILGLFAPASRAGELRILGTNHYRLHTDLDRSLAEDLGRRMDAMWEEYARRLANFDAPSGTKFDVYLFSKRKDYLKFTGGQTNNSAGVTMRDRNIVAAFLEGEGRDELRRTLQHEAFHQFACTVIHKDLPPWINEGLAVMFQEGIWTGNSFLLGQVPPRRVRQLKHDVNARRVVDFKTMLSMPHDVWNEVLEKDKLTGGVQYQQAWAMCHMLVYAADQGKPKYRARFLDMLQRIHRDVEPMQAFREAFSANIEGFQTRFVQWAKTLQPTQDATLIERQDILADMLIDLGRKGRRFDGLDDFRDYVVRIGMWMEYSNGHVKWETERDARVYFRTLDGRPYNHDDLFFDSRSYAPMPDMVLRATNQLKLRTRFHNLPGGAIEHETIVEPR